MRWLAPIGRRACWPFVQVALARFDFEVAELQLPQPHACPWDPLVRIGRVAEEAVVRHWGPGALAEVADDMLEAAGAAPTLRRLLKARQEAQGDENGNPAEPSLLALDDLRRAVLGSVVNLLAHRLPADEERLTSLLKDGHDSLAPQFISEGIRGAEQAIDEYLERALSHTTALVHAIREKK